MKNTPQRDAPESADGPAQANVALRLNADADVTEESILPVVESADALTIVGLGAAAGGVEALEEFFAGVTPLEAHAAFLVRIHPAAEAEGGLLEALRRATSLPVQPVTGPVRAEAGHIYVLPAASQLVVEGDVLSLTAPEMPPPDAASGIIDLFFRTLAAAFGPQTSGVVLSGMGSDGTQGLGHIKEAGGLTVAQSPGEARSAAMPRSAIAAGKVDFVLPARNIAPQIAQYWDTSRRMRIPSEAAPSPRQSDDGPDAERAFRSILQSLHERTGHDFSQYKRATVLRRIGRRLQMNNLEDLPSYLAFVRRYPAEAGALLQDLLISVTHFFRDREAWEALEQDIIPRLFAGKGPRDEVRAWVCGCATGEEAYSLGILLLEYAARMESPPHVQVFATDLDARAISAAREAVYSDTIAQDVSAGRLQRWFYQREGYYQVRPDLRETVLFAVHDVFQDMPFSRLDLVTCRNLLIYIDRAAQERIFELFHFALRPEGRLLLGLSETVDDTSGLFGTLDKRHRIYQRRVATRSIPILPPVQRPGWSGPASEHEPASVDMAVRRSLKTAPAAPNHRLVDSRRPAPGQRLTDLHQTLLLDLFAPPSVLIGPDRQILHLSSGASRFFRFDEGMPTLDLLQAITPDLRLDLTTALYAVEAQGREQRRGPTGTLLENGLRRSVSVTVRPLQEPEEMRGSLLIFFEETAPDTAGILEPEISLASPQEDLNLIRQLEQTIAHLQAQLRSRVEQYEASSEELMASNEEQQAVNEELRSVTEEMETGREELQSLNEELRTVNHELKNRVDEVSRTNSDLQNLLSSTNVGTVFIGRDLQLMRYTRAAELIFNIIAGDVGRPLAHLTHQLDYSTGQLVQDVQQVLRHLIPIEREVQSTDGRSFLMRLLPYRTLDDRIDGVVLTFLDITERRHAEEAVRQSEEKFRTLFDSMDEGYCIIQMLYDREDKPVNWRFLEVNQAFEKHNGLVNATGRTIRELAPSIEPKWAQIYGRVAETGESLRFEENSQTLDGRVFDLFAFPVGPPQERKVAVLFSDITTRKQNEWQQAFLLKLSDVLRPQSDAVGIQAAVTGLAMKAFGADRCYYGEIKDNKAIIRRDSSRGGLPPVAGVYSLDDYPLFQVMMNGGSPLVVKDVNATDLIDAELKQLCIQMKIISFINVPVIEDNQHVGSLCVTQSEPRNWVDFEVKMAQEVAKRTWAAVEYAHAEAGLREAEEEYRTFVSATSDVVYKMSADWSEMRNLEGKEFILTTSEAREDWTKNYIPEADEVRVLEAIQKAIQTKSIFELEHRINRLDGSIGWTFSRAIPVLDSQGEIAEWLGAAQDVTERKRAEEALHESEERFRVVADTAPVLIWETDGSGVIFTNQPYLDFFGVGFEAIRGMGWAKFLHPEDAAGYLAAYQQALARREPFSYECRFRRADGEYRWLLNTGQPLNVEHFAGAAADITENKRAGKVVQQANEALAYSNETLEGRVVERTAQVQELLRQLVGVQEAERTRLSRELHDQFGQQITGFMLGINALEAGLPRESESAALAGRLREAAAGLSQEVHRLAWDLRPSALDDMGLSAALSTFVREWGSRQGIAAEFHNGEGERLPTDVETALYRIAQEALTNVARHAAGADRVSVLLERRPGQVQLVIEDNGPGFDPEAAMQSGRLGLRGMQERAMLLDGTLEVESSPGAGSTLFVRIPLVPEGENAHG